MNFFTTKKHIFKVGDILNFKLGTIYPGRIVIELTNKGYIIDDHPIKGHHQHINFDFAHEKYDLNKKYLWYKEMKEIINE